MLRLYHGHAQARLTVYKTAGNRQCVQLVVEQAEIRCRCEIASRPMALRLAPPVGGLAAVELDWGHHPGRWEVMASDGDEAKGLLSSAVRLGLDRLWLHPLPTETTVSLMPGWMVIRKVWNVPRATDMLQFLELAFALRDQLQVAGAAGIEFLASDEAQVLDDAQCSICGDKLGLEMVFCSRCQTPHHRECWDYGGGCSTYGCGGRVYFVPHEAPLAAPHYNVKPLTAKPAKPR
jgi:hypothetical protein